MTNQAGVGRAPDFRRLFEAAPGHYLVLTPQLEIAAVSESYLAATMTRREAIVGKHLFEVFPDNPDEPGATGTSNLRASLSRVLKNKAVDAMPVQKYDIRRPAEEGGEFEERYWSPVNSPVLAPTGEVQFIIHRVEDVTEFVRLKKRAAEVAQLPPPAETPGAQVRPASQSAFPGILIGLAFGLAFPAILEGLALTGLRTPAPGVILLTAVVLSSFLGGIRGGLISAGLLTVYSFYAFGFFSDSGARAATFLVLSPIVALCVGLLRRRSLQQAADQTADAALREREAERRLAQMALKIKEDIFRTAIEASLDAFSLLEAVRDENGKVVDFTFQQVNARLLVLTGFTREQMIGKRICELFPVVRERGILDDYIEVMRTRKPSLSEFQISAPHVNASWLAHQIVAVGDGVAIFTRDVTDQKKLEDQLRQSQKMESVGRLAGGVAHDFNNLLTVIIGYANLAKGVLKPADNAMIHKSLDSILTAGGRAADLTRQLLAFARRQVIEPKVINLNHMMSESEKMLSRLIGEDVELVCRPSADLWQCKVDAGQVSQVLVNLAVNARDAMPRGGKLTLETSNVTLDENYAKTHPEVKPGEYVLLAISDTGLGMDDETKRHVFEPFFTTKKTGKGTGLGLATCYGIVKQNGGHIWYYSELDHGTTFKIYFPRCTQAETADAKKEVAPAAHGQEVILLVEDEAMVREFAVLTLRGKGYNVIHAGNGVEALSKARDAAGRIDLLITDVVMPGMSGKELAEKMRATRGDLRVLFSSGYTANVIVHHGVLDAGVQFLPKPFTPEELARKVREVLDGKTS